MKKIFFSFLFIGSILISCGGDKDKTTTDEKAEASYTIKENTTKLNWTAYKTTEKKPVSGEFTKINVTGISEASAPQNAIVGLDFSVPVSSIFSNNEARDTKLQSFFFGIMENTEFLSGSFSSVQGDDKEGNGIINLKMNNLNHALPFNYSIDSNVISIASTLNINSWQGGAALDSLNKACYDLHTGDDGVSKTWEDVAITASVELEKK